MTDAPPLRVGVIGLSEGNGHPFSFAAIVNGYHEAGWPGAGWDVIWRYLRERDPAEFGFPGVSVTHAWTQDAAVTAKLCKACRIPHAAAEPTDFIGQVDAVLLARDDFELHAGLAFPLLEAGLKVFVDKPLALDETNLERFTPYLQRGQLMSCSGFRYARELDALRSRNLDLGELRLVRGAVLNDFERYGIHLLEAVCAATRQLPVCVSPVPARHASVAITLADGTLFQLDALGDVPKTFQLDFWGTKGQLSVELQDNFSAFRRTLGHFFTMCGTQRPVIPPEETLRLMHTLIAGRNALNENKTVEIA